MGTKCKICYFFFKEGNNQQDNCAAAMCALLHQLFSQQQDLLGKHAEPMRKKYGNGLKLRFKLLWELFVCAATDPSAGRVICIIDALDECQEADRKDLISCFDRFYSRPLMQRGVMQTRAELKFFVTSRPYHDIRLDFFGLLSLSKKFHLAAEEDEVNAVGRENEFYTIEDKVSEISREILHYIREKVKDIAARFRLDKKIEEALHDRFRQMHNRTYLWAHLMLEELENAYVKGTKRSRNLAEVFDILPMSVEDAYEKILQRCDPLTTRPLLELIVAAQRPLKVSEIDVAFQIQLDMTSSIEIVRESDQATRQWLRNVCGLFVQISRGHVFFSHQTAREFLMRKAYETAEPGRWRHSIDLQKAHRRLADVCVAQLLLQDAQIDSLPASRNGNIETLKKKHPFLTYSAYSWANHVREAENDGTSFLDKTVKLCTPQEKDFRTWTTIIAANSWLSRIFLTDLDLVACRRSALHCAVELGLHPEIEILLDRGPYANGLEDWPWEVMETAARHEDRGLRLISPFLTRLRSKVLLKSGVLEAVASNGSQGLEIMKLLLDEYRDQVDITEEVLNAAAENEYQGTELMILLSSRTACRITITDELIRIVMKNSSQGCNIMEVLLDECDEEIDTIQKVFKEAVENITQGSRMISLLLDKYGDKIKITPTLVNAAAMNPSHGFETVKMLLSKCKDKLSPQSLVEHVMYNNYGPSAKIMDLLLGQCKDEIRITRSMIRRIADKGACRNLKVILDKCRNEVNTEDVVESAIMQGWPGYEMIEVFLRKPKHEIEITARLAQVALKKEPDGIQMIDSLVGEGKDKVKVTQEAVEILARNDFSAWKIIRLILEQRKGDIRVTQGIVQAAADNNYLGYRILKRMLEFHVEITPGLVKPTSSCVQGEKVIQLLRDYHVELEEVSGEDADTRASVDHETV